MPAPKATILTGKDLAQWRVRMDLTQREAANQLGIALTTFQELERGRRFRDGTDTRVKAHISYACQFLEWAKERGQCLAT